MSLLLARRRLRATAASLLALPLLAVATPVERRQSGTCSTGSIQCCNSTVSVRALSRLPRGQC